MSELRINSDFNDFYDGLSNENSLVTYQRYLAKCKQRGAALKYLRNIGVKTIDLRPVNQYLTVDGNIVVYTNPMGHNGQGKRIMNVTDAQMKYGNCVASLYIENSDPITIKYLQIGKKRFNLYYRKRERLSLDMGDLVDIRQISDEYNRLIALPIYSIDYIPIGNEMRATDFNEVQSLGSIGFERYMRPEEVVQEVRDSIVIYNKA